jgi:DNA-binding transcriptional ArsR family regulator
MNFEGVLRALMHPARLDMLVFCEDGPLTSAELAAKMDLSPSTTRRHLRLLVDAHLLARDGTRYRGVRGWVDLTQAVRAMQYEVFDPVVPEPELSLLIEYRLARRTSARVLEGLAATELNLIAKYAVPPADETPDAD